MTVGCVANVLVARLVVVAVAVAILGCHPADPLPTAPTAVRSLTADGVGIRRPTNDHAASVAWSCLVGGQASTAVSNAGWTIVRESCPPSYDFRATSQSLFDEIPGPPPTNLRASIDRSTVGLYWDHVPGPHIWQVDVGSAPGLSDLIVFRTLSSPPFTFTEVPPGVYYLRVRAASGDFRSFSTPSNELTLTIGGIVCNGAPISPPTNLSWVAAAENHVDLAWTAPSGAADISSYVLEVGSATRLSDVGVFDTRSVSTGLKGTGPAGVYFARVRAKNACGIGPASNEATVYIGILPDPPVAVVARPSPTATVEVDGVIYPICSWRACRFFGIDSTGVALRYYWDFGDGTTGTGPFVAHTYARPDRLRQFTVKLTVVDAFGRSSTAARDFYLHPVY